MPLFTIFIIFLAFITTFWLVYKYTPEPLRTVLLWVISGLLILWLLYVTNIWSWMAGAEV